MQNRTCIVALPNALASGVCGLVDVLGTANLLAERPLFNLEVRTPSKGRDIHSTFGLRLGAKPGLPRTQQHLVLVPGFGVTRARGAMRQIEAQLAQHRRAVKWLRRQADQGAIVAGCCVGTFLLAEAGLLDGRSATTTWWLADRFAQRYPRVRLEASAVLVGSGSIITGGAAMSHLDLALHLVERFAGPDVARQCAKVLVLDHRRSQAAYSAPDHARSRDPIVQRAVAALRADLFSKLTIDEVAKSAGTTPRTLARRFRQAMGCTPQRYRIRLRIDAAKALLEQPGRSVEDVAYGVGYGDLSAFYRAFVRDVGMPPRDYQRRFRPE